MYEMKKNELMHDPVSEMIMELKPNEWTIPLKQVASLLSFGTFYRDPLLSLNVLSQKS